MLKKLYHFLSPRFQNLFLEYPVHFKPRYGHGRPPNQLLYDQINRHRTVYRQHLEGVLNFTPGFHQIKKAAEERGTTKPGWNNGYLPGLDIITLYYMIATKKPRKYMEVGSGNSTKVARQAIEDQDLSTKIISIDPHPRAEIDAISDEIIRQPFETLDCDIADELEEGDILFVDNSHRILPNSDAMAFFMEVLPRLKKGVIVQVHDIYLPFDYPQFMCDRFYSEQYGLAIALMSNPEKFKILLPNYFISEDPELSSVLLPIWDHPNLQGVERHGGSFWFAIAS